jgi:hypothetical protein
MYRLCWPAQSGFLPCWGYGSSGDNGMAGKSGDGGSNRRDAWSRGMVGGDRNGLPARRGDVDFRLERLDGVRGESADSPKRDFRGVSRAKGKLAPWAALPVKGVVGLEEGFERPGIGIGADGEPKTTTLAIDECVAPSESNLIVDSRSRHAGGC